MTKLHAKEQRTAPSEEQILKALDDSEHMELLSPARLLEVGKILQEAARAQARPVSQTVQRPDLTKRPPRNPG